METPPSPSQQLILPHFPAGKGSSSPPALNPGAVPSPGALPGLDTKPAGGFSCGEPLSCVLARPRGLCSVPWMKWGWIYCCSCITHRAASCRAPLLFLMFPFFPSAGFSEPWSTELLIDHLCQGLAAILAWPLSSTAAAEFVWLQGGREGGRSGSASGLLSAHPPSSGF